MNTVEEYFDRVRQLFQNISDAQTERYEEHLLSATRGNLRIRLRFSDKALLEISEAIVLVGGELHWLSYRYHYQDSSAGQVFRYDNTPHHPEIATHPDHKHSGEQILASIHPSIEQLLEEVRACRERVS
jgi:Family of unknown function (DUF6516)